MKKILLLLLSITIFASAAFGFVACGKNDDSGTTSESTSGEPTSSSSVKPSSESGSSEKPDSSSESGSSEKPDSSSESGSSGKTEYTDEENLAYWLAGMKNASERNDNYTFSFSGKNVTTYETDTERSLSQEKESRSGNKYYRWSKEYDVEDDESLTETYAELTAIKTVSDNGVTRTKRYEYVKMFSPDGEDIDEAGYYVAPDEAAEKREYSPSQFVEGFGFSPEQTYEQVCKAFENCWKSESDNTRFIFEFSLKRNDDGAVTFAADIKSARQGTDVGELKYSFIGQETYSLTVKDGKFTKCHSLANVKYDYPDNEEENYVSNDESTTNYTYDDFDEKYYASIDVTTEETYHEYVGYINFFVNGYSYNTRMSVPVGEKATADDIKKYFTDWDTHCNYNTLISKENYDDEYYDDVDEETKKEWIEESKAENAKFMAAMQVFTDAEMTKPLDGLTISEVDEEFTVYVKLTPPQDDAWVLCVIPSNNENHKGEMFIRFIQGCANRQDGTFSYNSNNRLSSYPVVSVDGETPAPDGLYIFEGGTIHVFICENKYA